MSTAITPEVLGVETQILEDSPMSESEQRKLIELETKIKTKLGSKMEADLAIGEALLQIQRERLYRGPEGGRKFEDYIKQQSHRLTLDGQPIGEKTAAYLRGFYYFREEVLPTRSSRSGAASIPLPTSAAQVRPLLFLLDHLRRDESEIRSNNRLTVDDRRAAEAKAIAIWKAACSQAGNGKAPTFDQVNSARLADAAAEQHRLRGNASNRPPVQPTPPASSGLPKFRLDNSASMPPPPPPATSSPAPIPSWELDKDDSALDAGVECRNLSQAVNDAQKAVGNLRAILYSRVNTYGRDYMGFLRQVDAGVYSVGTIDARIEQMNEDLRFVADLLVADVGEGELARSTIDVSAFPTRA